MAGEIAKKKLGWADTLARRFLFIFIEAERARDHILDS
jgi:hypothetical protein